MEVSEKRRDEDDVKLLRRIKQCDLFVCKTWFHESFRRDHISSGNPEDGDLKSQVKRNTKKI